MTKHRCAVVCLTEGKDYCSVIENPSKTKFLRSAIFPGWRLRVRPEMFQRKNQHNSTAAESCLPSPQMTPHILQENFNVTVAL